MPWCAPVPVSGDSKEHGHLVLSTAAWLRQQGTKNQQCLGLLGKYVFMHSILMVSRWHKTTIIRVAQMSKDATKAYLEEIANWWIRIHT